MFFEKHDQQGKFSIPVLQSIICQGAVNSNRIISHFTSRLLFLE